MSISGVSNSNYYYQPTGVDNTQQQRKSDFQSLTAAIQSGNLGQAQQAFNSLTQGASASSPAQNGQVSQDFQAIGQALKSGDIAGAQKALTSLQTDVKSAGTQGHHHHHHHAAQSSTDSTSSTNGSDSSVGSVLSNLASTAINLLA